MRGASAPQGRQLESPALEIINILKEKGARVSYYDPYLPYLRRGGINLKCARLDKATLKSADCAVVITDHSNVDYEFIAKNSKLIIDTRNALKNISKRSNIVRL